MSYLSNVATALALGMLLAACSSNPPPNLGVQRCYQSARNEPDRVIDNCTHAINSGQLSPRELAVSHVARGYGWLFMKHDYDQAIDDFNAAIRLEPESADPYDGRSTAHFAKGEIDASIADENQAIQLDPKFAVAYVNRGVSWHAKGDETRARTDFDQAIGLDSNNAAAYSARGEFRFDTGDFSGAAADLSRAARETGNPHPALYLFLVQARLGQDGATTLSANATRINDSQPWVKPVTDLFLGRNTPASVLASAQTDDDRCNVQFYVSEWQLMHGDHDAAAKGLYSAADSCPKSFIVYRGALAELARLGQVRQ